MQDTGSEPCPLLSESGTFRENPEVGGWKARSGFHVPFTGEGQEEKRLWVTQKDLQICLCKTRFKQSLFLLLIPNPFPFTAPNF